MNVMSIQFNSGAISQESQAKVDELVSHFHGTPSTVARIEPPGLGRNNASNHLVLTCTDDYVLGIKKQNENRENICREAFVYDVSILLEIPHCKMAKQEVFPLPGWTCEYVKIEWGINGQRRRPNFGNIQRGQQSEGLKSVTENTTKFLESFASNFAINFHLAISDRSGVNFLWDLQEQSVYSIDNEMIGGDYRDSITSHSNLLKNTIGPTWFDNADWRGIFENCFLRVCEKIKQEQQEIRALYKHHSLDADSALFEERLKYEPKAILSEFLK